MKKITITLLLVFMGITNVLANNINEKSDIYFYTSVDFNYENGEIVEKGFEFSNDDYRLFPAMNDFVDKRIATTLMVVNGKFIRDNAAFIENDYSLVPVRNVMEEFNATVEWEGDSRTVTIIKDNVNIKLKIGSRIAYVNDEKVIMPIAPRIINDSTYVPLAFVSETLDYNVSYWGNYLDDVFHSYLNIIAIEEKDNGKYYLSEEEAVEVARRSFNEDILNIEDEVIYLYDNYGEDNDPVIFEEQYTDLEFVNNGIELGRFYSIDIFPGKVDGVIEDPPKLSKYKINRILIDMYTGQRYYKYAFPDEYGILDTYKSLDGVLSPNIGQLYDYLQEIKECE